MNEETRVERFRKLLVSDGASDEEAQEVSERHQKLLDRLPEQHWTLLCELVALSWNIIQINNGALLEVWHTITPDRADYRQHDYCVSAMFGWTSRPLVGVLVGSSLHYTDLVECHDVCELVRLLTRREERDD